MNFATRLRAARLARGLTQQQVADAIGITRAVISGYETQDISPRVESIAPLCRVLMVSADWLLDVPLQAPQTERQKAEYRDRILEACAAAFEVTVGDITGTRRFAPMVAARHAAMWMISRFVGMHTKEIGRAFGKDHSTVVNARQSVDSWQEFDAPLWTRVEIAMSLLGRSEARQADAVVRTAATSNPPRRMAVDRETTGLPGATLFHLTQTEAA